ncbi:ABC transporter permease [Candidatus Saccharibacteria bacterium]|jgi:ABC-2 type transport system permease protein|nr:ABC transporter permease [Candidatus Saccharibacteria bacterium]
MSNFRRQILPITTFIRIDVKRMFRDKVAIFFVFLFPLIFLFVFGGIFGKENDVSFKVALMNNSETEIAKNVEKALNDNQILEIDSKIVDLDTAKEKMTRGELDATIILPETFGQTEEGSTTPAGEAEVLYNQNNEQGGRTLEVVLEGAFRELNSQFVSTDMPFTVKATSTATESQRRFDYVFAGLLGFSILSLGIFGPTSVFPRLKQRGVLRRYSTTTLKVWQYFVANVFSNAFAGILSVSLMFITSLLVFNLNMNGDYISLALIVILGTAVLFGIGLSIGGWAKNENQAAPLANLVTFPMMFLSGTFFPRFAMPEWLQGVSGFLPLTPVIDGIRLIVTEGKTIFEIGPQVGLLAIWAVIIYTIAFKVFRWE